MGGLRKVIWSPIQRLSILDRTPYGGPASSTAQPTEPRDAIPFHAALHRFEFSPTGASERKKDELAAPLLRLVGRAGWGRMHELLLF